MGPSIRRDQLLAVDPGVTTGYAYWHAGRRQLNYTGQADFEDFVLEVHQSRDALCAIVCESYTITQETMRKSRQNASLELIGFLRALAIVEHIPFVLQSPGDAKRFGTDEKLESASWLVRPKTERRHANDALRHLLLYLVKRKMMGVPR